ncbi:hypothetical protein D6089_20165 [Vibrio vulnificus]|nr:hypothetical protein [Vibrio vulnificus]
MRPVIRNAWPVGTDQKKLLYKNYSSFFPHLVSNFGNYCSYCECVAKLDVEHVVPKSHDPALKESWTNLLLGCSSCNRDFKKNHNPSRAGYLWPDEIDTFKAFVYYSTGNVEVRADHPKATEAQATLELCGLAPPPKSVIVTPNDYLWHQRALIWTIAEAELSKYGSGTSTKEEIARMSSAMGHWSVWITVFIKCPEVVKEISNSFKGTHTNYLV